MAEASEHLDRAGSEPALPLQRPAPCPSRARLAPTGVHSVGPAADFKTISPRHKESPGEVVFLYERGSRPRERMVSAQRRWPGKGPGPPLPLPPPAGPSLDEWKTLGPPEPPTCPPPPPPGARASSRQWPSELSASPKRDKAAPCGKSPGPP